MAVKTKGTEIDSNLMWVFLIGLDLGLVFFFFFLFSFFFCHVGLVGLENDGSS